MAAFPLTGVRFHLSGSVPSENHQHEEAIKEFVATLVSEVLREGGTILHGSHPSLIETVLSAARTFVEAGGSQESFVLVRIPKYARTDEQKAEIELQRESALVHIIPSGPGAVEPLVEMRTWMAERSDAVVAIGGRWWAENKVRARIPKEIDASLKLGKPGFICAGFGGAAAGYLNDSPDILRRLKNGLSCEENEEIAWSSEPAAAAHRIVEQVKLLPLVKQRVACNRLHRILSLDGEEAAAYAGVNSSTVRRVAIRHPEMVLRGGQERNSKYVRRHKDRLLTNGPRTSHSKKIWRAFNTFVWEKS